MTPTFLFIFYVKNYEDIVAVLTLNGHDSYLFMRYDKPTQKTITVAVLTLNGHDSYAKTDEISSE